MQGYTRISFTAHVGVIHRYLSYKYVTKDYIIRMSRKKINNKRDKYTKILSKVSGIVSVVAVALAAVLNIIKRRNN